MNIKSVLGIIFGVILVGVLQHYIYPTLFKPSFDSQIMHFASEMNKNCPFMVDSETRLDNTVAGEGKSIIYNYTLINYEKNEVNLDYFQTDLKPTILNSIRTNSDMKYLRENQVTFVYNYKDKVGIKIASLKFTPKEYNM